MLGRAAAGDAAEEDAQTARAAIEAGEDPAEWGVVPETEDEEEPELERRLIPVWIAFQRLSRARPSGMGAGAIQMEAVLAYCVLIGLEDLDLREAWLEMIQRMDQAWLEHQEKKRAEQAEREAALKRKAK